jgi:tetratricopeptide (TPR) repeat protein
MKEQLRPKRTAPHFAHKKQITSFAITITIASESKLLYTMTVLSAFRNRTSTFSVGLDPDHLERLLCQSLLQRTRDVKLVALLSGFKGLGARCHSKGLQRCIDELNNAATMLTMSLSSAFSRDLPTHLVLEVHSAIGLIRETQGQHASAIQSYLKAFWVAKATANIPQQEVGRVLHRLGIAYGFSGKYQTGRSLLEKAIDIYATAHLDKESCTEQAAEALKVLEYVWYSDFANSKNPKVLAQSKGRAKGQAANASGTESKLHCTTSRSA